MYRKTKPKKGIMLITILFLTVFLVMFGSAAMVFTMAQQRHTLSFYQNEAALKMAEAGISYAMSRLAKDKLWTGYNAADSSHTFILNVDSNEVIKVNEHGVTGEIGWVEGQVVIGTNTVGYFELYFAKPTDQGEFYKTRGPAGANIPGLNIAGNEDLNNRMVLSVNNLSLTGLNEPHIIETTEGNTFLYSQGDPDTDEDDIYYSAPANSVLLSVRGRVGNAVQSIETGFRFVGDEYDSAAIGRGNVNITICGTEDNEDINVIDRKGGEKPSIIRSTGEMNLGLDPNILGVRSDQTEYINFKGKGQFESGAAVPSTNPLPTAEIQTKLLKAEVKKTQFPKLTKSIALENVPTESIITLPAGTYIVEPRISGGTYDTNYPKVTYYPYGNRNVDNIPVSVSDEVDTTSNTHIKRVKPVDVVYEGEGVDKTSEFADLIDDDKMQWNPMTRKLTIKKTVEIAQSGSLVELVMGTRTGDLLSVQMDPDPGDDPKKTDDDETTFLVNRSGGIFIDGQLSGIGSVVCNGSLDLQAMSEYVASRKANGVTLYVGGAISVNEVDPESIPYMEFDNNKKLSEALLRDYNEFASLNNIILYYKKKREAELSKEGTPDGDKKIYIPKTAFSTDEYSKITLSDSALIDGFTIDPTDPSPTDPLILSFDKTANQDFINVSTDINNNNVHNGLREFCRYNVDVEMETFKDKEMDIIRQVRESTVFKGLIFSCKDFKIDTPYHSFKMEGMLVAFGGDVNGNFDETFTGHINIRTRAADFTYDSEQTSFLTNLSEENVEMLYWIKY